jgi:hypothetical protein
VSKKTKPYPREGDSEAELKPTTPRVQDFIKTLHFVCRKSFILFRNNTFADHHTQEEIVKESPLDWIIVRAAILKDDTCLWRLHG